MDEAVVSAYVYKKLEVNNRQYYLRGCRVVVLEAIVVRLRTTSHNRKVSKFSCGN